MKLPVTKIFFTMLAGPFLRIKLPRFCAGFALSAKLCFCKLEEILLFSVLMVDSAKNSAAKADRVKTRVTPRVHKNKSRVCNA